MAFDKVDRTALKESMRRLGASEQYIDIIADFYSHCQFHTVGGEGEERETNMVVMKEVMSAVAGRAVALAASSQDARSLPTGLILLV